MIKEVYIVENLHGINYFLSEVKDISSELIITGNDKSVKEFLSKVLKNVNYFYIPNDWYIKRAYNKTYLLNSLISLIDLKDKVDNFINSLYLNKNTIIHIYSRDINFYKFFLINSFHNDYTLYYTDLFGDYPIVELKREIREEHEQYLKLFKYMFNLNLEWIRYPTFTTLHLKDEFKKNNDFKLLSWNKINQKIIPFKLDITDKKKVLIIDDCFTPEQLDIEEMTLKINQLFNFLRLEKFQIYIKEHYRAYFSTKDLLYTDKDIIYIDKYLPIELFQETFQDSLVLSYLSASTVNFRDDSYCFFIFDFMSFNNKEYKENYDILIKKLSKNSIQRIKNLEDLKSEIIKLGIG